MKYRVTFEIEAGSMDPSDVLAYAQDAAYQMVLDTEYAGELSLSHEQTDDVTQSVTVEAISDAR